MLLYLRQEGRGIGIANKFALMRSRTGGSIRSRPTSGSDSPTTNAAYEQAAAFSLALESTRCGC